MATTGSLRLDDPYPKPLGPHLVTSNPEPQPEQTVNAVLEDGVLKVDNDDGTTTIHLNPSAAQLNGEEEETGHEENIAKKLDDSRLQSIASELLEGLERDEMSRKGWLDTRRLGIELLGLKLEKPRTDVGQGSAPLEGMSTVRHPMLLDATVSFQATARAELLPAGGPAKIRNDTPSKPPLVATQTMASQQPDIDDLGDALEKDFNHYLTYVATEYVPDTDRMLFYVGFGGDGFKKVYNCPLKRRTTSESVDAEDLIVSDYATDLKSCKRISHRIKMPRSTLRRMQILGVYRDVEMALPQQITNNPVDKAKAEIDGVNPNFKRPEDRDYEVFEIYCELDLDEYAPEQFKGKGLPLPYRVTVEKETRKVLDIRRNWKEDDKECWPKQYFVQFPFIRGLGFYGLGYIHLLGNTTIALTAAWRIMLDNGMFANFPGFLYSKGAVGRQLSSNMRVGPGQGLGLDIGAQAKMSDAVAPLPYKETGPSFTQFIGHVEDVGRRLASTANINVGEGKQDAPVGTTLALIEQATKVVDSAHKRLYAAQAEELKLIKERLLEDPECFWRHDKTMRQWQKDQFVQALKESNLVPVADPNNPTSLHRLAKAVAIAERAKEKADLYDPMAVELRILRTAGIDPTGLFRPQQAAPPPDPRLVAIQQKAASADNQNQIQLLEAQIKAATTQAEIQDKAQDRASREKVERMKIELQKLKLQGEMIIHSQDAAHDQMAKRQQMALDVHKHQTQLASDHLSNMQELHHDNVRAAHEMVGGRVDMQHERQMEMERHRAQMERDRQKHEMELQHAREKHEVELENARQMAKVKPAAKKESK